MATVYVGEGCNGWSYVHNGIEDMLDGTPIHMSAVDGEFCDSMNPASLFAVEDRGTYFETEEDAIAAAEKFGHQVFEQSGNENDQDARSQDCRNGQQRRQA